MIRPRGKEEGGWLGLHKQHGKREDEGLGRPTPRNRRTRTAPPNGAHSPPATFMARAGTGRRAPGLPPPRPAAYRGPGTCVPVPHVPPQSGRTPVRLGTRLGARSGPAPVRLYTSRLSQHFIPHSRGDDSGDRETFKCGNASARTQPEKAKSNPKKERPRFSVIVTVILDEATFPRAV